MSLGFRNISHKYLEIGEKKLYLCTPNNNYHLSKT